MITPLIFNGVIIYFAVLNMRLACDLFNFLGNQISLFSIFIFPFFIDATDRHGS